jgi:hypothetical protein
MADRRRRLRRASVLSPGSARTRRPPSGRPARPGRARRRTAATPTCRSRVRPAGRAVGSSGRARCRAARPAPVSRHRGRSAPPADRSAEPPPTDRAASRVVCAGTVPSRAVVVRSYPARRIGCRPRRRALVVELCGARRGSRVLRWVRAAHRSGRPVPPRIASPVHHLHGVVPGPPPSSSPQASPARTPPCCWCSRWCASCRRGEGHGRACVLILDGEPPVRGLLAMVLPEFTARSPSPDRRLAAASAASVA